MEAIMILLGVGYVLLGPIAFFLTLGARSRLELAERKVKTLEVRLADVEKGRLVAPPRAAPDVPAAETVPVEPQTPPAIVEPIVTATEPPPDEDTRTVPESQPEAVPPEPEETAATVPLPGGALPPVEPPPASVAPSAPEPAAHNPSFEERLGTRWAVWVGGIALAIGALLLVRQAILQGFFGPGARIVMGLLFSVALAAAGEWLRRREAASGDLSQAVDTFSFGRPSIPAMLTAAGTIGAFGSVYAAHALYEFIGPAFTFIALGAIGIATMFAAGLHGPMLAGLGLVGAMVTPLLITSSQPSAWPVVIYIAVVAMSAYMLARLRLWFWLACATAIGAALWTVALLGVHGAANPAEIYHATLAHLLIQTALALFVLCYEPWRNASEDGAKIEAIPTIATLTAGLVAFLVLADGVQSRFDGLWIATACALVAMYAAIGLATYASIMAVAVSGAGIMTTLVLWRQADDAAGRLLIPGTEGLSFVLPQSPGAFGIFALVASLGLAAACAWRVLRQSSMQTPFVAIYAGTSVLTPFLALIIVYLRLTAGERSTLYGSLACGLALALTGIAHLFRSGVREGEPKAWNLALAIYASAAIAALALAFVFVLDGGAMTVAFALAALGAALVSVRLDIPALRWCVVGLGAVVAARYMWEPRISSDIGTTPILNWLLFGYGIPALAFGYAARAMRIARGEDMPVRIGEALAIMCSALLVFFEIRHFINGGDPYAMTSKTIEIGLFAIASLAFALVLMRLDLRRHSIVMNAASYIFGAGSVAISAIGLGLFVNPLFARHVNPVEGGLVFNALMLAYLLPGLMALLIARMADGLRPRWYVMMMRILAVGLVFGYLTLQVRRVFQGASIHMLRSTSDGEWYTYSIVWLAFGVALLAYGLWRRSVEVRLASAIFIVLSVLKVFLFDLNGLEGVLRALSFIGLGLVLIGIGLVYQKFVFVRKAPEVPPSAEAAA